jgi:hypothetical protein
MTLNELFWCVKLTFWSVNILFRAFSAKKISRRNLTDNLFRLGSRSGRFRKSDLDLVKNRPDPVKNFPDPVKNRPDPQH